ncbi:Heat shock 70 kDa protein [Wickerhamomyces ciferrii]|uniref:Heat shock 70 kDa protein n=1 Tax=Wickerhamomyces ciferrii (strain ATCC 14091 / BCRC 22168 / CBS 111 / JCM 3599 / NBRC 0793 / NRRL Y-1031 F-60-10) TaxID=1206466 RepID=K0KT99_WICCF|nr:Heat shock 70 kDa protein [Wickerhamomyces ciferrii]CCH45252.1 Heat shock 70 kDa protein [Wickerhamomyces ciferrii]
MTVIGVSFGNTTSSIAAPAQDGKGVEVIANPDGERAIPSALAYVGEDEYHGGQALAQLIRNPKNTIINFRDYVGQSFSKVDPTVTERASHAIDLNGQIGFQVTKSNEAGEERTETVSAEEATVRHLGKLKAAAADYLGTEITGAVVAVSTDFTEEQKAALVKAGDAAGLKVLQIISEPSAALLAHASVEDRLEQDKTYVVADIGGIRTDAAVISVRGGILTTLATAHDYELGGDKLDDALAEFIAKEFEKKYKVDPRKTARSLAKLKDAAILARKTLSNVQSATISIESLADGIDYHSTINRLRFELVARNVLSQLTGFVENLVKKANLDTLDIDEVLLAGGVSFTPKLASNIQFIFPESTVVVAPSLDTKASNPDELVARGAALQATLLENFDEEEIKESLSPVIVNTQHISKAIGIVNAAGEFVPILKQETTYPIRRSIQLDAPKGDVLVSVYEGDQKVKETVLEPAAKDEDDEDDYSDDEPEVVREKHFLPGTKLADLAVRDIHEGSKVEVTLNINKEGTLQVSAREVRQGSVAFRGEITY